MKFRTKYDERKPVFNNPGSRYKIEFQVKETSEGLELEPIGQSDFYAYIQSHADSVDIHKILERCALMDDYSYMNRYPGTYDDITEMPKSLAEAYEQIQNARDLFDRMPVDVKESYDNNFVQFISGLGDDKFKKVTEDFLSKMKVMDTATAEKIEVNTNES